MKSSLRAGSILAALALSIVGCDPAEPRVEEPKKSEEHSNSKLGPASPPAPVVPSPTPALPSTSKSERDAMEKKDEAKPAENTGERKPETGKTPSP